MACIHEIVAERAKAMHGSFTKVASEAGMLFDTLYKFRSHAPGSTIHTLNRLLTVADMSLLVIPNDVPIPAHLRAYLATECAVTPPYERLNNHGPRKEREEA